MHPPLILPNRETKTPTHRIGVSDSNCRLITRRTPRFQGIPPSHHHGNLTVGLTGKGRVLEFGMVPGWITRRQAGGQEEAHESCPRGVEGDQPRCPVPSGGQRLEGGAGISVIPDLRVNVVSRFDGDQQQAIASKLPADSSWAEKWDSSTLADIPRGYSFAALKMPDGRKGSVNNFQQICHTGIPSAAWRISAETVFRPRSLLKRAQPGLFTVKARKVAAEEVGFCGRGKEGFPSR